MKPFSSKVFVFHPWIHRRRHLPPLTATRLSASAVMHQPSGLNSRPCQVDPAQHLRPCTHHRHPQTYLHCASVAQSQVPMKVSSHYTQFQLAVSPILHSVQRTRSGVCWIELSKDSSCISGLVEEEFEAMASTGAAVVEPRDVDAVATMVKNPESERVATPTCTVTSKKDESLHMRAVEFHGKMDMKVNFRPRPMLTDPADVILRVTTSCICGSDLHMYMGTMPGMKSGDVVGHEFMGVVEAVGPDVKEIHEGDRVVSAFDIACGQCSACHRQDYSGCDSTNPSLEQELMYNDRTCGMFGYSHLTGGWEGGQAEYVRIPFADLNCLKVPEDMDDEHAILLSDILPTAWHANELARVGKGDNVAIWGAGPVGILAAQCAFLRGAARVVIIDEVQFRLDFATEKVKGIETINFKKTKTIDALRTLFPHGPDVGIDAVGVHYVASPLHKFEVMVGLETDSTEVINEIIYAVRKGGRIGIIGAYAGFANHFNLGAFMEKGMSMAGGQTPVQKYWPTLLPLVKSGELDPTTVITHILGLGEAPEAYKRFNAKDEGWVKVLLKPASDPDVVTETGPGLKERARNVFSGAVTGTVNTAQSAISVMSTDVNKGL